MYLVVSDFRGSFVVVSSCLWDEVFVVSEYRILIGRALFDKRKA
jgi:hypothetical protein